MKIYTDGSYKSDTQSNKKRIGYAFYIPELQFSEHDFQLIEDDGQMRHNKAEIIALGLALEYLLELQPEDKEINFYLDSEYLKNTFDKWMHTWMNPKFYDLETGANLKSGKIYANRELLKPMFEKRYELEKLGYKLKFIHIKSHNKAQNNTTITNEDIQANNICDKLASGVMKSL